MIIAKQHVVMLNRLLADKESGQVTKGFTPEEEQVLDELQVQSLIRMPLPVTVELTYTGEELARVMRDLVRQGTLPMPGQWTPGSRWLGSEIIAMLEAAQQAGVVGPVSQNLLLARGLAVQSYDTRTKRSEIVVSEAGKHVLELYHALEPDLQISASLADFIRKHPRGPTEAAGLPTGSQEEHLLEGMRLIAYSVPESEVYTFTDLGQAVKSTLESGGFGTEGSVLTRDMLSSLAAVVDDRGTPEAITVLQNLGYLDADGKLLPAGEWALEVLRLLQSDLNPPIWTFAISEDEAELLHTISDIWNKFKAYPGEEPTFQNLRREMIGRKDRFYRQLLERYGRRLDEMPKKYREISERFARTKDLESWYDDNFKLRTTLISLEASGLIERDRGYKGKEIYRLTEAGRLVEADHAKNGHRSISSTGVKTITMTHRRFASPNLNWFQQARADGLIGTSEPTESGMLYASLAETIQRQPYVTAFEMKVLKRLANWGMDIMHLYRDLKDEDPAWVGWALEKLEAFHLIDILPDGNIVETEAGKRMDRALSGVPAGVGNPVNPDFYRVIKALAQVGNIYSKERLVRVLDRKMGEAVTLSGLSYDEFKEVMQAARAAGLVGRTSVNEAGLALIEAVEMMNPPPRSTRELHRYQPAPTA